MINNLHVDYSIKKLNNSRKLTALYREEDECSPAFFKIGHPLETFQGFGKDFLFKQQANNFAMIDDISELIFLRTSTGILSGQVASLGSRLLLSLENSRAIIKNTTEIIISEKREVGKKMFNVF